MLFNTHLFHFNTYDFKKVSYSKLLNPKAISCCSLTDIADILLNNHETQILRSEN